MADRSARPFVVVLLLAGVACALGAAACADLTEPGVTGVWGGQTAYLVLGANGGQITYQCGSGTLDPGWSFSSDGTLHATGQHFFGGGPVPSGGRKPHPAAYEGRVDGDRMTLRVTLSDTGDTLGPYELVRDGPVVTEICL